MKKHYIIPIFVPHRGCPHDCVFCNQKHITGQESQIDAMFVEEEIEKHLTTIPRSGRFVEVSFFGGSFTGLPINEQESLLKPARKALELSRIDAIRLSTRPDYIDDFILKMLRQFKVSIIELGVQSMDNEVLTLSNRGHTIDDVINASNLIKEYGFALGLQMMVGLPGDNEEKDLRTAHEFARINPEMVRIYPALVIKDTYMETMYKDSRYTPLSVEEAVEICSKLYLVFERAGINIIRVGLQPTENICPGKDLIAGPFHPSFRELVESRILNEIMEYLFNRQGSIQADIFVNGRTVSKLYADKKKYYKKTLQKLGDKSIRVFIDDKVPQNSIMLKSDESSQIMSIKDYSFIY